MCVSVCGMHIGRLIFWWKGSVVRIRQVRNKEAVVLVVILIVGRLLLQNLKNSLRKETPLGDLPADITAVTKESALVSALVWGPQSTDSTRGYPYLPTPGSCNQDWQLGPSQFLDSWPWHRRETNRPQESRCISAIASWCQAILPKYKKKLDLSLNSKPANHTDCLPLQSVKTIKLFSFERKWNCRKGLAFWKLFQIDYNTEHDRTSLKLNLYQSFQYSVTRMLFFFLICS